MGYKTSISWTESTWSPVRGCSRVSQGCVNCYAERLAGRFGQVRGGAFEGFAQVTPAGARWTGKVELIESQMEVPIRWRSPRMVFVNSMSDTFHEALPFEVIDRIFTVMVSAPQHTYQVLTKRAKRMAEYFASGRRDDGVDRSTYHLMEKIWIGVSVEDQKTADERIPYLLDTPAEVRFVSYEPALDGVDFTKWLSGLSLIIIGGESGPGARPFDIAWARQVIAQCRAAGVKCFVKQLGPTPFDSEHHRQPYFMHDSKGGDPEEWPPDLRIREMPVLVTV